MDTNGLLEIWPLQRLVHTLRFIQKRDDESWKDSSVLMPFLSEKDFELQDRDEVVAWVLKRNKQFQFHTKTFFLATGILDRFLSSVKVQSKYLKCIAISCLYLASKVNEEEDMIPRTGDLVTESDCGCRVCDVLRMERIILEKLSWNINLPTALDYLHVFQVMSFSHFADLCATQSLPNHMAMLSNILARLVCHSELAKFSNATVALALVSIELEMLTSDSKKWTCVAARLQALSKVTTDDLMTCRQCLLRLVPSRIQKRLEAKLTSTRIANTDNQFTKVPLPSNGAIKRKAATPSPNKPSAHSKKPHPETNSNNSAMKVNGLTPLESIGGTRETSEQLNDGANSFDRIQRRTYAEIVKYGLGHHSQSETGAYVGDTSRPCGFQASYCILSPNHNRTNGIKI